MGWRSGMPTRGRVVPGIGCKLPMLAVCKGNCQNALLITFLLITCRLLLQSVSCCAHDRVACLMVFGVG